jgi:hypothetical protein
LLIFNDIDSDDRRSVLLHILSRAGAIHHTQCRASTATLIEISNTTVPKNTKMHGLTAQGPFDISSSMTLKMPEISYLIASRRIIYSDI